MTGNEDAQEVYDQAALWAAKVDAGALDPADQAALDRWLEADSKHFGAFAQASAHLVPLSSAVPVQAVRPRLSRRRMLLTGSVAASAAALAYAGFLGLRWFNERQYATRIGELRVIPLTDGSVVSLNTDSEVVVHYSKAVRAIELVRGEALFDVAKNKQRPFIVLAGNTRIRAVGTSFTVVNLPGEPVQVLVREGIVEISRPNVPVAPVVRVAMNTRAVAPADAPIEAKHVEVAEVTRELAWRVGRIAFHGETLAAAAAEFARYSEIRIRIDDPNIAKEKVTGLFVSSDPVGFSKAVATSFDLRAQIGDKEILLTR